MKKHLIAIVLGGFFVAPFSFAEMHEFTSAADESKKLWAEVTAYDAKSGKVSLRRMDKSRIVSPVSAFIASDKAFIENAGVALAAGRYLSVSFEDEKKQMSEKKNATNGYRTVLTKDGYKLNLRNNGKSTFKGMKAEYQIYYAAYANPFKDRARTDGMEAGEMDLPELAPREETDVSTEGVDITTITRLPVKECAGGT